MIRKIVKKIVNSFYRVFQKRPSKVVYINTNTVDKYFEYTNNVKVFKDEIDSGIITLSPKTLGGEIAQHFSSYESKANICTVLVEDSKFQFNQNVILDQNSNVLYQEGVLLTDLPIIYSYISKPKKVIGTIAYLSNSNVTNYGHWFQYTLPLLEHYWKHIGKDSIDFYYLGGSKVTDFQKQSLSHLGIKENQILNIPVTSNSMIFSIKNVPIQFGFAKYNNQEFYHFLRRNFKSLANQTNSKKRYYIKRGEVTYRKVIEEKALIEYLKENGFEIAVMDGLSLKDQATIFSSAEIIIVPHGSALTNCIYCNKNTKIVELFPHKYLDWSILSIIGPAKLDYHYLEGEKVNKSTNPPIYNDIYIPLDSLKKLISKYAIF